MGSRRERIGLEGGIKQLMRGNRKCVQDGLTRYTGRPTRETHVAGRVREYLGYLVKPRVLKTGIFTLSNPEDGKSSRLELDFIEAAVLSCF